MAETELAPTAGPEETGAAISRPRGHATRHPSPKEYIRIAILLGLITAAEVGIYYAKVSRGLLIPSLFFFSIVKFALVVLWFMHLRFDSRTYARFFMMGLAGAVTLYIVVLLTFKAFAS